MEILINFKIKDLSKIKMSPALKDDMVIKYGSLVFTFDVCLQRLQ